MRFDTKIGIVVRSDLAAWQRLNVTAFLAGAIAGGRPEVMGDDYEDGSGNTYLPMFRQPVVIYQADLATLRKVREKAVGRGLGVAVYTEDMFKTGNDEDNRAAVRAYPAEDLNLVGLALYGPKTPMDKSLKGLTLHP
ncbi:DUF2000 domain-containing protein [Nonomuraea sp. NPDC049419]|uniref:DUF2000 domain-containing protein n=1 Tax=Nonomuraea sp. NPDC049419 TaxID=3155772 RepID=UPI003445113C